MLWGVQAHSSHIADRALAAFIIIHAALKRSRCLRSYAARPDLQARMPNFQVRCCACQTAPVTPQPRAWRAWQPAAALGGCQSLGRQAGRQACRPP